jgi:methionyl aminopeptidase
VPIILKSPDEIALMRQAGRVNALAIEAMTRAVRPGVSTRELDHIATEVLRAHGATPVFLGYPNASYPEHPYPATINASINDELVHGVPGGRRLREGDIVSLDCGCTLKGWVGDSAVTLPVGRITTEALRLLDVTREALRRAIEASRVGNRVGDVSATIQEWVESQGYAVVREYTGHGVGREMHEEPQILNWGKRERGVPLRAGMAYALEPMVCAGSAELYVKPDYWTVATMDGKLCAHFEHTVAITDGEPEILTLC